MAFGSVGGLGLAPYKASASFGAEELVLRDTVKHVSWRGIFQIVWEISTGLATHAHEHKSRDISLDFSSYLHPLPRCCFAQIKSLVNTARWT